MNVYNTMPGVAEMGMVWMGAGQTNSEMQMGIIPDGADDMVLDHDNYYTSSHNSVSSQSMDDLNNVNCGSQHTDSIESYEMMHLIDMRPASGDSNFADDDNSNPVYMITTATQTLPCPTRKIKPIKHPGLVLKTPIAYDRDTDPSVLPIQKDGIAVCEKCGAIGVKHAFYTKERRFCSLSCARSYTGLCPDSFQPDESPEAPEFKDIKSEFAKYRFTMKSEEMYLEEASIKQPLPQIKSEPTDSYIDDTVPLVKRKISELANSYDWDSQLHDQYFVAAPVSCFKHAPLVDVWENVMVGMKVEVENTDCDDISEIFPDSFWVATVMKIVGYKAQLRYEGFGSNSSKDFWISLCSNVVHPVGWCATRGMPLIPPTSIQNKYADWKDFLRKRLTGARTLPSNYSLKASESQNCRFRLGLFLEVVDKNRISQVKVAIVRNIIGKRLYVKYFDLPEDAGFWCHEDSPLLHPVGWANKVGHRLVAPIDYLERVNQGLFDEDYALDDLFTPIQKGSIEHASSAAFSIGMKLEAIDPLNLSSICVATVMEVLKCGYIMISIDTYDMDATGADWFCYHIKSPCIFPVGFCNKHNIPLTAPKGYDSATFNWQSYLKERNYIAADSSCFNNYIPLHGFVAGMKIEAADLMDPRLVCVATIAKVVGRVLKIHFDGWEEEYDQWLDCESPDIYPVGWCYSVGHKLEGPRHIPKPIPAKSPKVSKKKSRKKKNHSPGKTVSSNTSGIKSTTTQSIVPQSTESQSTTTQSTTTQSTPTQSTLDSPTTTCPSNEFTSSSPTPPTPVTPDLASSPVKSEDAVSDASPGPETGAEPAGPDQSLPVSAEVVDPPSERKVTSYVNNSNISSTKHIPRLIDNSGGSESGDLCPEEWNVFDVAQFLRVNDCANYCDTFCLKKVDGKSLLSLKKEDVLDFTGGKVGPSLKIFDLIQQLIIKVNPSQMRLLKANIKKKL